MVTPQEGNGQNYLNPKAKWLTISIVRKNIFTIGWTLKVKLEEWKEILVKHISQGNPTTMGANQGKKTAKEIIGVLANLKTSSRNFMIRGQGQDFASLRVV